MNAFFQKIENGFKIVGKDLLNVAEDVPKIVKEIEDVHSDAPKALPEVVKVLSDLESVGVIAVKSIAW